MPQRRRNQFTVRLQRKKLSHLKVRFFGLLKYLLKIEFPDFEDMADGLLLTKAKDIDLRAGCDGCGGCPQEGF